MMRPVIVSAFAVMAAFLASAPDASAAPVRRDRPIACPMIYMPVCAVRHGQRRTYSNACMARGNKARVIYSGACHRRRR